jgi:Phosphotransferase enzyme family
VAQDVDLGQWLRRALITLGALGALLLVTGLYLTFKYRPEPGVHGPGVDDRSWLVGVAQALHGLAAYLFVIVVFATVGLAIAVTARRGRTIGAMVASGLGLVFVSLAFIVTGRQLPWNGISGFARGFDGIIGFPGSTSKVIVGSDALNPSRYETVAWIHVAGLTVFAVFAAWWLIGALQSRRDLERDPTANTPLVPQATPGHSVSVAEQFFGTDDPDIVRNQVDTFLVRHLRVGIREIEFTKVGAGIVLGVLAADNQRLVVKIHPPGTNTPYLRALQDVQIHLAVQGYPAPKPVLDPQPFGVGVATVESRLSEPSPAEPADPGTRHALAEGLAAFVRFAAPLARHAELAGRGPLRPAAAGSVFPPPPGSPFDFAATAAGAEWIEEIGARARTLLEAAPRTAPVVGHFDWRSENVPVTGGRVVAVFDWDSVGAATEAVVVGSATHHFTLDWRSPTPHVPTLEEVRTFVADYEQARGKPFSDAERVAARTAYVFCTAYGARCEHVLASSGQPAPTGFRDRLASAGAALLG